jgi:hypothetical protein
MAGQKAICRCAEQPARANIAVAERAGTAGELQSLVEVVISNLCERSGCHHAG